MSKTLDEWLDQLDADPESLIPVLATPQGREDMQVTSLAITVPNVMAAMQRNGASFLEAAHRAAPLLRDISCSEALLKMPLRSNPELLWAWWLAQNEATQLALDDWKTAPVQRLANLAFDWAWMHNARIGHALTVRDKSDMPGLDTLLQALPATDRLPFERLLSVQKKPELDTPEYRAAQRNWRVAIKVAQPDMRDFIPRMNMPPVIGASLAVFECAQRSTQESLLAFVQACPQRLNWRETDFVPHQRLLKGPWRGPLGGFALMAGSALLYNTSLLDHPENARLASTIDALGVDVSETSVVMQMVLSLIAPQEIAPAPSHEMGALFGAD